MHSYEATEGKLHGIANQVEKHLLVPLLVTLHHRRYSPVHICAQSEVFLLNLEAHDLADLFNCAANVEKLRIDLEFAILDPTHVEGVLNHMLQMHRRVQYDVQIPLGSLVCNEA